MQAAPSFLGFDVDRPGAAGRSACIRALEEQAAYVVARPPRDHRGAHRPDLRRDRVHRRRGQGPRCGRRSWPTSSACPCASPSSRNRPRSGRRSTPASASGIYDDAGRRSRELVRFERTVDPEPAARRRLRRAVRALARALPPVPRAVRGRARPPDVVAGRAVTANMRRKGPSAMPEADSSESKQFHEDVPRGATSSSSRDRPPTTGGCRTGSPGSSGPRAAGP